MLWESRFWKDDLLRYADRLTRARKSSRPTSDVTYVSVEKSVLLGLFSVRKLLDSHKLSVTTAEMMLRATAYPSTGERVTWVNNHRLDELYDFKRGRKAPSSLRFICNQAIHSHVFAMYLSSQRRLVGIYLASDRQRHKDLLAVPLVELERAFRRAGRDYPSFISAILDEKKGDYVIQSYATRRDAERDAEWLAGSRRGHEAD